MRPGDRFRDYILERMIGEGGMGEVWLARHAMLGKAVAIKAMAEGLAADAKFRERFISEARAMAALHHPHIVGATDFFEDGRRMLLVMPFVEGRSLGERIDATGGPLPVEEALHVSGDILGALDYAHRKAVIHRDVKPSNILVDVEGTAYLTDFGIALMVGDARKTKTGFSLGSPHYMSPEQIERPRQIDHRTDVYSFGCVLFEMLCGRPPFVGDGEDEGSDFQVRKAHVMAPPPAPRSLNPAVPAWLEGAILKALEKEPAMRYQGCGEFARTLAGAGKVPAAPAPKQPPARPPEVPEKYRRESTVPDPHPPRRPSEMPEKYPESASGQGGTPPGSTPSTQKSSIAGRLILGFIAVGVIAAIAVPNVLDSVERSRQKRTLGELKTMAVAIQSFSVDYGGYPPSRLSGNPQQTLTSFNNAAGSPVIVPDYIRSMPEVDGWGRDYMFTSGPDGSKVNEEIGTVLSEHFTLGSCGADRQEGGGDDGSAAYFPMATRWCATTPVALGTLMTHCYESDIVWGDSSFLQAPDGKQRRCK